ncbi:LPS export ABC transporter periplasmic protein LptC [Pelomicrobium methylotrophicum]|uniref:LPS export ABC transporter periplasmic protein LptC n=1 Tax=Pelomicrobium methylotrophicum TaxID=2602750 RepID=UPI001969A7F9|nr:LPS export ABC transporter periplasmic protein LptC [Pelomicrobium methylotrophicum]
MDLVRLLDRVASFFPVLLLAALAALTYWLDRSVQPPAPDRTASLRHDPDFIAEGFSAVQLGPDGRSRYVISGQRLIHYPDDDTAHVEEPRVLVTEPDKPPVRISARRGMVSADAEHVYLMDEVRIERSGQGEESEAVLTTRFLHLLPKEELARTDEPVTLQNANTVIHGVGLEFNHKTRIVTIHQVKGRYAQANGR